MESFSGFAGSYIYHNQTSILGGILIAWLEKIGVESILVTEEALIFEAAIPECLCNKVGGAKEKVGLIILTQFAIQGILVEIVIVTLRQLSLDEFALGRSGLVGIRRMGIWTFQQKGNAHSFCHSNRAERGKRPSMDEVNFR